MFGKSCVVETDHKPLEAIFRKPLNEFPACLQITRMRPLQHDILITYKPEKKLYIAEALSRAYIDYIDDGFIENHVHCITRA